MSTSPLRFLVVDDNADSRMLLVKTLLRKFPEASIHECQQGDHALAIARAGNLSAVIAHRTYDYDGETLVALFRRLDPILPIVLVSGYDRTERALAAGANAFLNYDEWLRIGSVVADVMASAADARAALPRPKPGAAKERTRTSPTG